MMPVARGDNKTTMQVDGGPEQRKLAALCDQTLQDENRVLEVAVLLSVLCRPYGPLATFVYSKHEAIG